jgi:hypothetical protein
VDRQRSHRERGRPASQRQRRARGAERPGHRSGPRRLRTRRPGAASTVRLLQLEHADGHDGIRAVGRRRPGGVAVAALGLGRARATLSPRPSGGVANSDTILAAPGVPRRGPHLIALGMPPRGSFVVSCPGPLSE